MKLTIVATFEVDPIVNPREVLEGAEGALDAMAKGYCDTKLRSIVGGASLQQTASGNAPGLGAGFIPPFLSPPRFHPAAEPGPAHIPPGASCLICGYFDCVCDIRVKHKEGCRFRTAMLSPAGIACEPHGRDVCPICDPCTCAEIGALA